jgi:hypothetical protein
MFHLAIGGLMGDRPFNKPVFLRLNRTGNYQARSAWEALEYLDLHWPTPSTEHHRRAKSLCEAALNGIIAPEDARIALIDAAQRAGVLASGWKPAPTDAADRGSAPSEIAAD